MSAPFVEQTNSGSKVVEETKSEKSGKQRKKIIIQNLNLNDINNGS